MAAPTPDFQVPQFATQPAISVESDPSVDLSAHNVTLVMAPWMGGPVVASGSAVVTPTEITYHFRGSGDTRMPGFHRVVFISDDGLRVPTNRSYIVEVIEAPGEAG